jgi:hypothetical protein
MNQSPAELSLATSGAVAAPRHNVRAGKRAEDTAAGCRAKAAADLVRAVAPGDDYRRVRLERSAEFWSARADLLDRLEEKFRARTAAA